MVFALALMAVIPLRFHYDASEFTNVVYHVNCLTSRVPCTNSVFTRFWNDQYHFTRADGAELDAWLGILRKIESAAPAPPPAPFLPNYGSFYPSLRARYQIVTAAVESRTPADFRKRAARFLNQEEALRLSQVLDHFQRRLHPWWVATGREAVDAHIRQVKQRMKTSNLMPLAGQIAGFVEANLEKRDVFIHAIPGPFPDSKEASATVISNHFFVEIMASDKPDDTIWKAMHELTHAFFDSAPAARHLSLMKQFATANEPHSQAFYDFLNEAVATAVQLIVYERQGVKDDDPYHHPYIPRLGRSTMPLVKEAIAGHRTVFDGFTEFYLRAGSAELKEQTSNPHFILSAAAVLASEKNHKAADTFFDRIAPRFFLTEEKEWMLFTDLNAVRLLTYDELAPFTGHIANLDGLTRNRGFAYVVRHSAKGRVFFLAGRDTDALNEVVKQLAKVQSVSSDGLVLSIADSPTR
jgi:hypothetical protein